MARQSGNGKDRQVKCVKIECGALSPPGSKFCKKCGTRLLEKTSCPNGHVMDPSWIENPEKAHCPSCDLEFNPSTGEMLPRECGRKTRVETREEEAFGDRVFPEDEGTEERGDSRERLTRLDETILVEGRSEPIPRRERGRVLGFLAMCSTDGPQGYFELREGVNLVGRAPESHVRLAEDGKVSARHARIRVDGSGILYRDEWSTNGSRVNGSEVEGDVLLSDHDVVSIGETDLEVLIMGRLPSKEEERADDWGHATA